MLDGDPATTPQEGHSTQFSAHVCYGQTDGGFKMPLYTEVARGPGDSVLDGDPALPPPKKTRGTAVPPLFGSCIVAKRPDGSRCHLVRRQMRTQLFPSKRGIAAPQFSTHVCCGQTAGWIKMKLGMKLGLSPGQVLDGDPAPSQRGTVPQFSALVCCGQRAAWIKMPLVTEEASAQATLC